MGKGIVGFVTLYAIQTLLPPKPVVKHLKFKVNCNSQEVVYFLKCRICGEAPYVGKAKTKIRARFNDYKSAHGYYRKKHKVSQQLFHEH